MNKNKDKKSAVFVPILAFFGCAAAGWFFAKLAPEHGFSIVLMAAVLWEMQIIIHESGHLVFGLLSGYKFVSFRVGSLALIKTDGGFKLKSYSVAGTGGQCLMAPPPYNEGRFPAMLYNLGGSIMNLCFSLISVILLLAFKIGGSLGIICFLMAAFGVALALMNGIPMRTALISNDGRNALDVKKDVNAKRSFWSILKVNELMQRGVMLKDMDESLFTLDDDADTSNALIAAVLVNRYQRRFYSFDFEAAKAEIERVEASGAVGVDKNCAMLDKIYMDILENGREADTSPLEEKQMKRFLNSMKNAPQIIRTLYAQSIALGNEKAAENALKRMKRMEKNYPYPALMNAEVELMEIAKNKLL